MKRLWISVAILALLFSGTLLNSFYLSTFTGSLTELLTRAEQGVETGDWAAAATLTDQALNRWHAHEQYLYTVLRHAETDTVHIGLRAVQQHILRRETGAYFSANAQLRTQMELLSEMEQLSLKNLL